MLAIGRPTGHDGAHVTRSDVIELTQCAASYTTRWGTIIQDEFRLYGELIEARAAAARDYLGQIGKGVLERKTLSKKHIGLLKKMIYQADFAGSCQTLPDSVSTWNMHATENAARNLRPVFVSILALHAYGSDRLGIKKPSEMFRYVGVRKQQIARPAGSYGYSEPAWIAADPRKWQELVDVGGFAPHRDANLDTGRLDEVGRGNCAGNLHSVAAGMSPVIRLIEDANVLSLGSIYPFAQGEHGMYDKMTGNLLDSRIPSAATPQLLLS